MISYVTTNINKFNEAKSIFDNKIKHVDVHLEEIQSMDLSFVTLNKAFEAYKIVGRPLIVEDIGLFVPSLKNFPGPLIKWVGETMGYGDFAKQYKLEMAIWKVCVVYTDGLTKILKGSETEGIIVYPPKGSSWGFEHVFQPIHQVDGGFTVAELAEQGRKHEYSPRFKALEALKTSIEAHNSFES